jgi:NAD(P)H-hydrate repair Nnr-like enzyme with NAD(P)H-hydrate dehydratase domain
MKSADTFIASAKKTYVITDGAQSLAKGGSGDILAGLTAALLAQGYPAKSAAITAAEHHALLSQQLGSTSYDLIPEKLLYKISQ